MEGPQETEKTTKSTEQGPHATTAPITPTPTPSSSSSPVQRVAQEEEGLFSPWAVPAGSSPVLTPGPLWLPASRQLARSRRGKELS